MQKVTPFLWFDGKAEEAMNLYVSLFRNARIVEIHRAGDNGPVMSGTFEIRSSVASSLASTSGWR